MRTVIYFTRELPGLSNQLELAGLQVYEALAISEVLYLAEQHPAARIVVDPTIQDDAAAVIAQHYPTMRLKAEATAADVLFELTSSMGAVQ